LEKIKLIALAVIISVNSFGFILAGSWLNGIGVGLLVPFLFWFSSNKPNKIEKEQVNQISSYRKPAIDREGEKEEVELTPIPIMRKYAATATEARELELKHNRYINKEDLTLPAKVGAAKNCPNCGYSHGNIKNSGCANKDCAAKMWTHQHLHQKCLNCLSSWIRIKGSTDDTFI
jgi:hypothetical protein